MRAPELPDNEAERIAALHGIDILDTAPEADFDHLTALAAELLDAPIALVSLIDSERQWFKSRFGLQAEETGRDISFCGHAILNDTAFIVEDAVADERFADNPLVQGPPGIRFYVGIPLASAGGFRIGTLCVIDRKPRCLSSEQRQSLSRIAALAQSAIRRRELQQQLLSRGQALEDEVQMRTQALVNANQRLSDYAKQLMQARDAKASGERFTRTVANNIPALIAYWDRDLRCRFANRQYLEWFGLVPEQLLSMTLPEVLGEALFAKNECHVRSALRGEVQRFERALVKQSGEHRITEAHYIPDWRGGRVEGFFVMVTDCTEHKQLQQLLTDARRTLEQRIAERTADLAAANESIQQFTKTLVSNIEAERLSLSREVHDQLGQIFTGLKMKIHAHAASLPASLMEGMIALLDEGTAVARRIARSLRPPLLDDLGLAIALRHLTETYEASYGLVVEVEVSDDEHLTPDQGNQLYRITQEALTNVLRHAEASRVRIDGALDDGAYRYLIESDGKRFDPGTRINRSQGLVGMRERAALIGGHFDIRAGSEQGTIISVRFPVRLRTSAEPG